MTLFAVLILLGMVLGIFLFISLYKNHNTNNKANSILSIFILFVTLTLAGRYFYTLTPPSLTFYKILFIGDFLIFAFGPLLYFYLLAVFNIVPEYKVKKWIHFIPLFTYVVMVLPLMFMGKETFISISYQMESVFYFVELFAIFQNIFYLIINYMLLNRFLVKEEEVTSTIPRVVFIKLLLAFNLFGIIFWGLSFVLRRYFPDLGSEFLGYHMVWYSLSLVILLLGYWAINYPELFKFEEILEKPVEKSAAEEDFSGYIHIIESVMDEEKPYLEPRLTLADLSGRTGINKHILSKVINEYYRKNFFDFINTYRIKEFEEIAANKNTGNLTLLGLAHECGFNSKTTFNTAFKKLTKKTPGEYFKLVTKN